VASKPKRTIEERLTSAHIAVSNATADPEIQTLLAQYGYGAEKMAEGRGLYEAALQGVNDQTAAEDAQQQATAAAVAAEQKARDAYQALAQVARAVFTRDRSPLATLGLTGAMPRPAAGFLSASYALFDNAVRVASIRMALAEYEYDEARLEGERALIEAYDRARQAQEAAKAAVQQATGKQDVALQALGEWLSQFLKIARVALRGKPDLLEKLGIRPPGARTSGKGPGGKKAAGGAEPAKTDAA